ncbi:hypothetical protein BDF14DRAFT_1785484 [Spinellus fusiger]|nr:hypothetical protein BDF14DRAFT_1785484 [Spinellus fusiger]
MKEKNCLLEADIATLFKTLNAQFKKPYDYLCIYRWAQHILVLPSEHPLLPLYLQIFFHLYFASLIIDDKSIMYGHLLFNRKQDLLYRLRDRVAYLQTYYGRHQIPTIIQTEKANGSIKSGKSTDSTGDKAGTGHDENLRQLLYAMWLWIGDLDLLNADFDIISLPHHYCIDRLQSCRKPSTLEDKEAHQPWNSMDSLWIDMVNQNDLKDSFLHFPWEGAEKFFKGYVPDIPFVDNRSIYNQDLYRMTLATASTALQPPPLLSPVYTSPPPLKKEIAATTHEELLGSVIEDICHHATLLQKHSAHQSDLDTSYIDHITRLYINTPNTKTIKVACSNPPQKVCKGPAEIEISILSVDMDQEIKQKLMKNRELSKKSTIDSIDPSICFKILTGKRRISDLTDYYSEIDKEDKEEIERCIRLGWSCLNYALDNLENTIGFFPPSELFLRQLSMLVSKLIIHEPLYARKILDRMKGNEKIVSTLYAAFLPNSDPEHMLYYYQCVSDTSVFNSQSQSYLLPAFDMSVWSRTVYSTKEAQALFYQCAFSSIKYWMISMLDQEEVTVHEKICHHHYRLVVELMTVLLSRQLEKTEHFIVLGHIKALLNTTRNIAQAEKFGQVLIDILAENLGYSSGEVSDLLSDKVDDGLLQQDSFVY